MAHQATVLALPFCELQTDRRCKGFIALVVARIRVVGYRWSVSVLKLSPKLSDEPNKLSESNRTTLKTHKL
jgi:hypothetical protein